ncbi:MAG: deoxynucleoside kinase [Pseudomonadota bacterium]
MDRGYPFGPHRYIVVEGPIGVGKTTLVHRLAEHARARLVLEIFEENPFLADFYQDRGKYAFQTELFFLLSRFRQQQSLGQQNLFTEVTISDYLFQKSLIFAGLTLEDAEWQLYHDTFEALAPRVVAPDVVVMLDAPLEVLLARIEKRGRSYEKNFDPEYLGNLVQRYRREFGIWSKAPVLTVRSAEVDFSRDDEAVEWLAREIALHTEGHHTV